MELPMSGDKRRVIKVVAIVAVLLGCLGGAVAFRKPPEETRKKFFDGQVLTAYFPIDWTVKKGPPYLIEDYAAPPDPLRGSISVGDLYELPETNVHKELDKAHRQYVRSGIARSDIAEKTFDGVKYIAYTFKPKVRPFETYSKGYLTFPNGRSVRIMTIRQDSDPNISHTIDTIVASIRNKR